MNQLLCVSYIVINIVIILANLSTIELIKKFSKENRRSCTRTHARFMQLCNYRLLDSLELTNCMSIKKTLNDNNVQVPEHTTRVAVPEIISEQLINCHTVILYNNIVHRYSEDAVYMRKKIN